MAGRKSDFTLPTNTLDELFSQRIGGYNALDYLVKVRGFSFVEAVETLMGKAAVMPTLDRQTEAGRKAENSLTARKKQNDR